MLAILLERVSKRFRKVVLRTGYTTLKTSLTRRFTGDSARVEHVEALRDVTLDVPRGTTLGIRVERPRRATAGRWFAQMRCRARGYLSNSFYVPK